MEANQTQTRPIFVAYFQFSSISLMRKCLYNHKKENRMIEAIKKTIISFQKKKKYQITILNGLFENVIKAVSNNMFGELGKLIFIKQMASPNENIQLFAHEMILRIGIIRKLLKTLRSLQCQDSNCESSKPGQEKYSRT